MDSFGTVPLSRYVAPCYLETAPLPRESEFSCFLDFASEDALVAAHARLNDGIRGAGPGRSLRSDLLRMRLLQVNQALNPA